MFQLERLNDMQKFTILDKRSSASSGRNNPWYHYYPTQVKAPSEPFETWCQKVKMKVRTSAQFELWCSERHWSLLGECRTLQELKAASVTEENPFFQQQGRTTQHFLVGKTSPDLSVRVEIQT